MSFFDDELRKLQQQRAQIDAQNAAREYEASAAAAQAAQQQQGQGGLGGVLAGIGQSIGNFGRGLFDLSGSVVANWRDLLSNTNINSEESETQKFKKFLYGGDNAKDRYLRSAGNALDAAATASDFIPGLGAGAKVALNVGQGAVSGAAQELIDNGQNADMNRLLSNAAAGAGAAGVGQFVGNKLAAGLPGNGRISKALNSNIGRGALTGAAAGAVGGGLGTALNGGDLGQTLSGALQGAQGGALGGAAMGGTMGLLGSGINRLSNKVTPEVVDTLPNKAISNTVDVAEAPITTRRGIAVTDYDAGEQSVNVRRPNAPTSEYQLGKNAGSTIDGILGPNNARKLPNATAPTDADLVKKFTGGEYKDAAAMIAGEPDALAELKNMSPELYNKVREGAREWADINNSSRFESTLADNKSDLPMLDRQQYYDDTIGKLKAQGGSMSAADVPDYMRSHLRNGEAQNSLGGAQSDNASILRELFGNEMDLDEMYRRYEELAQAPNANEIYTGDNIELGARLNGLGNELDSTMAKGLGLRKQLEVGGDPSLRQNVDVAVMDAPNAETVYTRRTIAPKVQEQNLPAVRGEVSPAVQDETPLIQKGTPEYEAMVRKENIANRERELRDTVTNIVRDQYGTIRLNDRIPGLDNAIMELADLGLTKRSQLDGFANRITGANGEVPKQIRKALNSAGKVNGRIPLTMEEVYDRSMATPEAQKAIKREFDAIGRKYKVDENGNMDRMDMYDFGRKLESEGYKKIERGGRTENTNTEALGNGLVMLGQSFIEQATDGVDMKSAINKNALKNLLPGNEKWAAKVDNFANNVETVQDARSFIAPATKVSLLAQAAEYNKGTYGQRVGDFGSSADKAIRAATSSNPLRAGVQYAGAKAADSNAAKQFIANRALKSLENIKSGGTGYSGVLGTAGNIAGKIGDKISNVNNALNNATLMNGPLGDIINRQTARQAGLAAVNDADLARQQADAQNAANEAQANYQSAVANYNNIATQNATIDRQNSPGAQQLATISNAMQAALAAGDIDSYGKLASLYQQAYKIYGAELEPTTQKEEKALSANQSKALAASQQLDTLAQMTPDASTALANSPLGFLVNLTGGNEYANQAKALATTLGYLMSGANIRESEAERIGQAYVPSAFDSESVRQQKLARARQLIQSYMSDTGALEG